MSIPVKHSITIIQGTTQHVPLVRQYVEYAVKSMDCGVKTPQLAHITIPPWSSCYPKDKAFQSKELVNKITHSLVALINNDQLNCLHKFLPLLFLYPPAKSLCHSTAHPRLWYFASLRVDVSHINP